MNIKTILSQSAVLILITQAGAFAQNSGSIFDKVTQPGKISTENSTSSQPLAAPSSPSSSAFNQQSSQAPSALAPSSPLEANPSPWGAGAPSSGMSYGAQNSNRWPKGITKQGMEALNRYAPGAIIPGMNSAGQKFSGTTGGASNFSTKNYPGIPGHYAPMSSHGSLMDWALPQGYHPGTDAREAEAKQPQGQKGHPWGWYPRAADCGHCGSHHSLDDPCPICGWGYPTVPCTHSWYHED